MRLAFAVVVVLASVVYAENRQKRQTQQQYYPSQSSSQDARYSQSQQYQPASQYQQGQQQQYSQYDYQQQAQAAARRPAQATRQAAAPVRKVVQQSQRTASQEEEEEEEAKPSPLELLLERSTFKCESKKDGYYADTSVECKAFHYCIGGAKNSFMCAEGTVFHQVHLNCVPADQDICGSSEKYYFVNDYLNKELEQRGPNNTILYADRYYPEGFVVGDPIPTAPQSAPAPRAPAFAQQYEDEEPAPRPRSVQRPQARASAGVTYRQAAVQPAAQPAYRQAAPAAQPAYRQAAQAAPAYRQATTQAQPAQAYDPYAQYRGGQQQQQAGQNPYYRSTAASNQQAQYQYEDQTSNERGVKYDDE